MNFSMKMKVLLPKHTNSLFFESPKSKLEETCSNIGAKERPNYNALKTFSLISVSSVNNCKSFLYCDSLKTFQRPFPA